MFLPDYIKSKKLILNDRQIVRPALICDVKVKNAKVGESAEVRLIPLLIIQDLEGNFIGHFEDSDLKKWWCIYDQECDCFVEMETEPTIPEHKDSEQIQVSFYTSIDAIKPAQEVEASMILHVEGKFVRFFEFPDPESTEDSPKVSLYLIAEWSKEERAWLHHEPTQIKKKMLAH